MPTVNQLIVARAIRQAVYLERYKAQEVRDVVTLLNTGVVPDLLSQIAARLTTIVGRGYDTSVAQTDRLTNLVATIEAIVSTATDKLSGVVTSDLNQLSVIAADKQVSLLQAVSPIEINFSAPSAALLHSIVTSNPMQGQLLKDWFDKLSTDIQFRVQQAINIGLTQGESIDTIVKRIQGTHSANYADGVLQQARYQTEAIVRTAVNHVATQAKELTYAQNTDVISAVMMVATLDNRTTPFCQHIDGAVYKVGEGPRPPFHFNCRTTTVPVLRSWEQLNLAGTRASMDGQVPRSLTYGEWIKGQSAEVQNEALGVKRATMLRAGTATFNQFVDNQNKLLTLADLQKIL